GRTMNLDMRLRAVSRGVRASMSSAALALALATGFCGAGLAQQAPGAADQTATIFENVRIFDGKGADLSAPSNVLVRGNSIERISTAPIAVESGVETLIIDGGGRTLMPGLIDAHWHAMLIRPLPLSAVHDD